MVEGIHERQRIQVSIEEHTKNINSINEEKTIALLSSNFSHVFLVSSNQIKRD